MSNSQKDTQQNNLSDSPGHRRTPANKLIPFL